VIGAAGEEAKATFDLTGGLLGMQLQPAPRQHLDIQTLARLNPEMG
jgi:hypothetical protein